jgi:hypothetical protein
MDPKSSWVLPERDTACHGMAHAALVGGGS